jgi:hypothetical protein
LCLTKIKQNEKDNQCKRTSQMSCRALGYSRGLIVGLLRFGCGFIAVSLRFHCGLIDDSSYRLNVDLVKKKKSITTARKSMLKLVKLQSLAAKCCKMRKI